MAKKVSTVKKKSTPTEIIKAYKPVKQDKNLRKNIKLSIIAHVKKHSIGVVDYSKWYCGITSQTACARLKQHEFARKFSALYLRDWDAESLPNAHDIEVYFHHKGMKNDKRLGNATENSTTVYVFKENKTLMDIMAQILNPPVVCK